MCCNAYPSGEETASALLAGWTIEKLYMVLKRNEVLATVERRNADLMALREYISRQKTAQSQPLSAQDGCPPFEALWKSGLEAPKGTVRHVTLLPGNGLWLKLT